MTIEYKKRNFEASISDITASILKPIVTGDNGLMAKIYLHWQDIFIGFSEDTLTLQKITHSQNYDENLEGMRSGFILHLVVKPENFLEISHNKDIIISQANNFLGQNKILGIRVKKSI